MASEVIKTIKHGSGEIDLLDTLKFRVRFDLADASDCAYVADADKARQMIDARDEVARKEGTKLNLAVLHMGGDGGAEIIAAKVHGVHGRTGEVLATPKLPKDRIYGPGLFPDTPAIRRRLEAYAVVQAELSRLGDERQAIIDELKPFALNKKAAHSRQYGADLTPGDLIGGATSWARLHAGAIEQAERKYAEPGS